VVRDGIPQIRDWAEYHSAPQCFHPLKHKRAVLVTAHLKVPGSNGICGCSQNAPFDSKNGVF